MTTIARDDRIEIEGQVVTVVAVNDGPDGFECVVRGRDGLSEVFVRRSDVASLLMSTSGGAGNSGLAVTAVWGHWMRWAIPRIRSAVMATRPLQPYAHQDEAVFAAMLPQPRLRFLLADEPGTGKTLMTGMYMVEGRRRELIPGKTLIVVPAHLVAKWIRELRRFFGISAQQLTREIGRDPLDLRDDVDVWIVSVDLYTHNPDVRRKVVGSRASWSLVVFDEAHRLTPTSQYLGAAHQLGAATHHLLLLTATPHRGKEHLFRALFRLLDPDLYPWDETATDYGDDYLRPGKDHFLRRMKEELRDLDGRPLFPPRYAETHEITLTVVEEETYHAVMGYVDARYPADSLLARSIYGKRAASSLIAALETLRRRQLALSGRRAGHVDHVVPEGFDRPDLVGADVDSDEAWASAENAVVEARSRDRRQELEALAALITHIEKVTEMLREPAKWAATRAILDERQITSGQPDNQLLVFSEFVDTARWLKAQFEQAGFSTELLWGELDLEARDELQQRFLAQDFQVLVSTDAGGEGIDLQSASVMMNWDIPWSLVRLEQRAGRLHRIGQRRPVHVYHLVAPATREGRVQQVMLDNLDRAARALSGRIYDLLDATVFRTDFNYSGTLAQAQRGIDTARALASTVPDADTLVARAKEVVADEDRLHTPVNTEEALTRFAQDRVQAINPIIVQGFVEQVASAAGWVVTAGPAPGIHTVATSDVLPDALGGGRAALVAPDGAAVAKARADGLKRAREVIVLGPTEPPFRQLVELAVEIGERDLLQGASAVDTASLTSYTLFVYTADIEHHDGLQRIHRTVPFLIRYSGAGAFEVAWESIMNLALADIDGRPLPAARVEADAAAREAVKGSQEALWHNQRAVASRSRSDLDDIERRFKRCVRRLDTDARRAVLQKFAATRAERFEQLERVEHVEASSPRLAGWLHVEGGARSDELGHDPDAEFRAITTVVRELESLGWMVDDRQTAGVGYDLLARRAGSTEQRLIEVKGFSQTLREVVLEQHEWAQAQQRGSEYWLYVVTSCATDPVVALRAQDPAGKLSTAPRPIERFRIPVTELRRLMENSQ